MIIGGLLTSLANPQIVITGNVFPGVLTHANTASRTYTFPDTAGTVLLAGAATPLINGVAAVGISALGSRQDHVHPVDTSRQAAYSILSTLGTLTNASGILSNNGSGVLSWTSAGAGSVTNVSTAAANNGVTATWATATTTPALTIGLGDITPTSATLSTGLNITGLGAVTVAANKFGIDVNVSISRFTAFGPNTTTRGSYEFHLNSSTGTRDITALTISNNGYVTISSTLSANSVTAITGVFSSSLSGPGFSTPFTIADSGTSNVWVKLGTFTPYISNPYGNILSIKVNSHNGFNSSITQNQETYIRFKTSNGTTLDANGFSGDCYYYQLGYASSISGVKVVSNVAGNAATAYDIYIALSNYSTNSYYSVDFTPNASWLDLSGTISTDPGVASSSICVATDTGIKTSIGTFSNTISSTGPGIAGTYAPISSITMGFDPVAQQGWIQSYNATTPSVLQLNPAGGYAVGVSMGALSATTGTINGPGANLIINDTTGQTPRIRLSGNAGSWFWIDTDSGGNYLRFSAGATPGVTTPIYMDTLGGITATNVVSGGSSNAQWGKRTTNLSDFNAGIPSGFYDGAGATGNIPGTSWNHLINSAHTGSLSGNQYNLQIAADFWDQEIYFRKISPSTLTPAWTKLISSANLANTGLAIGGTTGTFSSTVSSTEFDVVNGGHLFHQTDIGMAISCGGGGTFADYGFLNRAGSVWSFVNIANTNDWSFAGSVSMGVLDAGVASFGEANSVTNARQIVAGWNGSIYEVQAVQQGVAYTTLSLNPNGGGVAIGGSNHADASLHIQSSQGGFGRMLQISNTAGTVSADSLCLIAGNDASGTNQWWSFGATNNGTQFKINKGVGFGTGLILDGSGNLSATAFYGSGTGLTGTATSLTVGNATTAQNILTSATTINSNIPIVLTFASPGATLYVNSSLFYNPSTNLLTVGGGISATTGTFSKAIVATSITTITLATSGATATIDCSLGNTFIINLPTSGTSATIATPTNPSSGQTITVIIVQGSSAVTTLISWPASTVIKWAGGAKNISSTLNGISMISMVYNGSYWLAASAKDFA